MKGIIPAIRTARVFFFLCAVLAASVTSSLSAPPSLEQITKNIQKSYEGTRDFSAEFVQKATIQSVEQTIEESGVVHIKKPKRMRWDYRVPADKKLVINPQKAWMYIPEDNMVYVYDSNKVLASKMTIRFLTGVWRLNEDFDIRFSNSGAMNMQGDYLLTLEPKAAGTGVKILNVTIDKKTYQIKEAEFIDPYDNRTLITFRDIKTNNNLPDSLFTFVPPPGAELFSQQ